MTTTSTPAVKKSSMGMKIAFSLVIVLCVAGGAAAPMVLDVKSVLAKSHAEGPTKSAKDPKEAKTVTIPFGDAVVNLAEERMQRYLRIKIVLVVDEEHEKDATEKVTAKKPEMKSWLIGHLCGKTLKDVAGTVGVNRVQREIFEKFEDILYPSGHGHLKSVLFEEYVVQ